MNSGVTGILQEGDLAPDFTLRTDAYEDFTLSSIRGRKVILFFYPKDNTPGCTQEAKDFTQLLTDFRSSGASVFGISRDDLENHEHFKSLHKLEVTLLADTELEVIPRYGVWVEKNMYGKKYMGIQRSTFLIDKKGVVHKIWRNVKVPGHAQEVLDEVKKMG